MEIREDKALGKKMDRWAIGLTIVILSTIIFLRGDEKLDLGIDFSFLPPIHATLNALVAISLIAALYFIKNKNIKAHRNAIFVAMVLSFFFVVSYVLYHFTTEETRYCQEGTIRYVYFFFLITHIILAGLSLPFILLTFVRGFTFQVAKHKKMARWVYPIWLYVAITGPIIYFMLAPCY